MEQHSFIIENDRWYMDLPEYLEQGGNKADLEMVAGADDLLSIMANGEKRITLNIDTEPFEGGDKLELVELGTPSVGGGYYFVRSLEGKAVNSRIWLCDVLMFVFGDIPQQIFVSRSEEHHQE